MLAWAPHERHQLPGEHPPRVPSLHCDSKKSPIRAEGPGSLLCQMTPYQGKPGEQMGPSRASCSAANKRNVTYSSRLALVALSGPNAGGGRTFRATSTKPASAPTWVGCHRIQASRRTNR
jgi:hypothetical protein